MKYLNFVSIDEKEVTEKYCFNETQIQLQESVFLMYHVDHD